MTFAPRAVTMKRFLRNRVFARAALLRSVLYFIYNMCSDLFLDGSRLLVSHLPSFGISVDRFKIEEARCSFGACVDAFTSVSPTTTRSIWESRGYPASKTGDSRNSRTAPTSHGQSAACSVTAR